MFTPDRIKKVVDRFAKLEADRNKKFKLFLDGNKDFLVYVSPPPPKPEDIGITDGLVNTPEKNFNQNFLFMERALDTPSDSIPFMWPNFGTGLYASMFGGEFDWRTGTCHYRYHSMEEVRGIKEPSWEDSEQCRLVVETLKYYKARTGDAIPIALTDTQSASDTATLVLDAVEFFAGCLLEPELMMDFLRKINNNVIKFSRVQQEILGAAYAGPGSVMCSSRLRGGIEVSDDNVAVSSPSVNRDFNLPLDEEIGKAMGGIAIHSCGVWGHTMKMLRELVPSCYMIDCAISTGADPNPNTPEDVRDILAGTGIILQVRPSGDIPRVLEYARRVAKPGVRLIVNVNYLPRGDDEKYYDAINSELSKIYGRP